MNLATARATKRSLEVGIKKVVGAHRKLLITQFLVEAFAITVLATMVSVLISELLLPTFNEITGKSMTFPFTSPLFLGSVCMLIALTTLMAGGYPAFYLSSFSPSVVLKGNNKLQSKSRLRQVLVVTQFTLSTILIIGTVGIFKQIHYINHKNLGLDKENVIGFSTRQGINERVQSFRQEALAIPGVEQITFASDNPIMIQSTTGDPTWHGKDPNEDANFSITSVDFDYLKTFKIPLKLGRDYDPALSTDTTSCLINEKTAAILGFDNPIGEELWFWGDTGRIIGVVEDFHHNSIHNPIEPLIIRIARRNPPQGAFVRIARGTTKETLASIEELFKKYDPEYAFDYNFLDELHKANYKSELMVGQIANYFAFIAIFISCLGLLGLSSFMAEQRNKEIGVRKVMGATVSSILILFSKGFIHLIAISFLLAIPFGYYMLEEFLENFAYRTSIGVEVYLLVGVGTITLAWLTTAFQSIKAARKNPVEILRYE